MKTRKKVFIFTTSRADYNLLKYLIMDLLKEKTFDVRVIVSGSHLSQEFGYTIDFIKKDNVPIFKTVSFLISGDSPEIISKSFSVGLDGFTYLFSSERPDLAIVLGDRYELLSIIIPAALQKIPIAHIHGGELSEGAIDDAVRHSVTKFSHLHFVSCDRYRKRVIQLGENPNRVFNVGAMALDYIDSVPDLDLSLLQAKLNFSFQLPFFLITYHPVTLSSDNGIRGLEATLSALSHYQDYKFIFTGVNFDSGHIGLRDMVRNFYTENPENVAVFDSLEGELYINLLRKASLFIGNSSSGIIEAPYIGTPFVNIGTRQLSRERCSLIEDVKEDPVAIIESINKMLPQKRRGACADFPYGISGASKKIVAELKRVDFASLVNKKFYDI